MSGGIAADFSARYPQMYAEYVALCHSGRFRLGDFFPWATTDGVIIYNLATQFRRGRHADLQAIGISVRAALIDAERRGLPALGLPRLGFGIGGLTWPDVSATLRSAGAKSTVDLIVATKSHPATTGETVH